MPPQLSVVVVAYDMARELPRTLRTLVPPYQRGIDADGYEIVVVDNGSPTPVDPSLVKALPVPARLVRIDDATPSPARAANVGLREARGELIGLVIDGARMASPGLLTTARMAERLHPKPVITAPAWHLGTEVQNDSAAHGYDQAAEDALLDSVPWERDGYRLFEIATFANSSGRGLFGPMGESSALFLHRAVWDELGGLDERFQLPGGGLVNHDLYRRACSAAGVQLVVLLGEGTFHQFHGGATTAGGAARDEMQADYEAIRGERYKPPANRPLFIGGVEPPYVAHVQRSVELDARRRNRRLRGE